MVKPHIAVIISSTRKVRMGHKPAQWIFEIAQKRSDLTVELLDLRDYPLPFFDEVASNAWAPTQDPIGVKWQKKLAEFDGYIIVTPEYNHSFPAVLKNALDYAYTEWKRKAVAFVGYGSLGAARAIEHLRGVTAELQMVGVEQSVHLQGGDFFDVWQKGKEMKDVGHLENSSKDLFDNLVWWASATKVARNS